MENWLEITVGLYLLAMVLYGHYRGFIRTAVSMTAVVVTFMIVQVVMPSVTSFVKNQTPIYGWITDNLENAMIPKENPTGIFDELAIIENMNLPRELQELLIENNNHQVYERLGVQAFTEYVGNYLAGIITNTVGFVVLFVIIYGIIYLLMRWLDLVAKLPILSGINKIAGALLGGLQGLVFLWLLALLVTAFSGSHWAKAVILQIESSKWLSFLYHYNIVWKIVLGLVKGIG